MSTSTGIQKELINVENMTVTTKITTTKRKLLTANDWSSVEVIFPEV